MKKFKDFIYDKNDILIALLVLIVAALIIWWRLDAIMEYPKTIFTGGEEVGAEVDGESGDDQSGENGENNEGDDSQTGNDSQGEGTQAGNDGQTAPTATLWQGGVLTRDVEVDVYGATASAAIQCLVDAGLFNDYAEYQEICESAGLDHEKVSAGTLTFKKGSSKEDVAKIINWS